MGVGVRAHAPSLATRPRAPRLEPRAPRHAPRGTRRAARHVPCATRHAPRAARRAPRATRHRPRATRHAPRTTRHAPRAPCPRHTPRATRRGPRATRRAPRVTRRALRAARRAPRAARPWANCAMHLGRPPRDGRDADYHSMVRMVENFSSRPEKDRSRRKVSTIPRKPSRSSPSGRAFQQSLPADRPSSRAGSLHDAHANGSSPDVLELR